MVESISSQVAGRKGHVFWLGEFLKISEKLLFRGPVNNSSVFAETYFRALIRFLFALTGFVRSNQSARKSDFAQYILKNLTKNPYSVITQT